MARHLCLVASYFATIRHPFFFLGDKTAEPVTGFHAQKLPEYLDTVRTLGLCLHDDDCGCVAANTRGGARSCSGGGYDEGDNFFWWDWDSEEPPPGPPCPSGIRISLRTVFGSGRVADLASHWPLKRPRRPPTTASGPPPISTMPRPTDKCPHYHRKFTS